jgi:hypothetical protein
MMILRGQLDEEIMVIREANTNMVSYMAHPDIYPPAMLITTNLIKMLHFWAGDLVPHRSKKDCTHSDVIISRTKAVSDFQRAVSFGSGLAWACIQRVEGWGYRELEMILWRVNPFFPSDVDFAVGARIVWLGVGTVAIPGLTGATSAGLTGVSAIMIRAGIVDQA